MHNDEIEQRNKKKIFYIKLHTIFCDLFGVLHLELTIFNSCNLI